MPKSRIEKMEADRTSGAALMHRDQLFSAASAVIDAQREARLQSWSFDEASVMLNTAIDTLIMNQAAFLHAKRGKTHPEGATSLINRDHALAHLLIAYGHYQILRPEVHELTAPVTACATPLHIERQSKQTYGSLQTPLPSHIEDRIVAETEVRRSPRKPRAVESKPDAGRETNL